MEITTVYQKERNEFGRPVNTFQSTECFLLDEFGPDHHIKDQHIERNPSVLDIQAIPEMSEITVNTERFTYIPQGMCHLDGGWPKDVDPTEKDQTQRYKKKVEKDEEYIRQVKALGDAVEGDIKQNYAIDIYQEVRYALRATALARWGRPRVCCARCALPPSPPQPAPPFPLPPSPGPTPRARAVLLRRVRRPLVGATLGQDALRLQGPLRGEAHRLQYLVVPRRRQEARRRLCHHAVPGAAPPACSATPPRAPSRRPLAPPPSPAHRRAHVPTRPPVHSPSARPTVRPSANETILSDRTR